MSYKVVKIIIAIVFNTECVGGGWLSPQERLGPEKPQLKFSVSAILGHDHTPKPSPQQGNLNNLNYGLKKMYNIVTILTIDIITKMSMRKMLIIPKYL